MFHPFELSQLVNNQIVCAYDIDIKIAAECSSEVLTEDKSPSSQVDTTTISLPTTSCTCLRSEVTNMSLLSVDIGKLLATDKQILSKLSREEKYHILTTETIPSQSIALSSLSKSWISQLPSISSRVGQTVSVADRLPTS